MASFFTPFKVGLLTIAATAAFIFMFGMLNDNVFGDEDSYTVYAVMDDATGLAEKSRVMMAGIAVGEVERIELAGQRARVEMSIRSDVELFSGEVIGESLVDGAVLSRKSASLLGDYYLQLAPGLRGDRIGDGGQIPTVIMPVSTEQLIERMASLGENLEEISYDIKDISSNMATVFGDEETANQMLRILDDVEGLTDTLQQIATQNQSSIDSIVANIDGVTRDVRRITNQTGGSVDAILSDVQAVTGELRHIMGQNSQNVSDGIGTITSTLASLQLALDNLNYSLENVQEITDRVADGEGTIGRLVTDDTIATETERAVTNAADLLESINRLETWIELRSEYALQENSFKNYFSLSLRPNPNKFYLLELIDDPRGNTETEVRTRVSTDPESPGVVYEEETITRRQFKVSVMMGQRWQLIPNDMLYIGGRFGILESSGGLGMNIWAFDDAFELRADLFDFGESERPRLRTYGLLYGSAFFPESSVLARFFIHGGADDILNTGPRDYFIGAGLMFNDRDLRGLLGVAPMPSF